MLAKMVEIKIIANNVMLDASQNSIEILLIINICLISYYCSLYLVLTVISLGLGDDFSSSGAQ